MTLPGQAQRHLLECAAEAVALQGDERAHQVLGQALAAGDVTYRWQRVSPIDLALGRAIEDPDGVDAIELSVAGRPIACIEAVRVGVHVGPDGEVFYLEPESDQPEGQVWGR